MKMKVFATFMLVGMLSFAVGMGTVAYFTSEATAQDNVFETGTLKIGVPNEGDNTAFITADNWQPGDSVTEDLTVKNLGSLPYKYKVSAEMTSGDTVLYDKLNVLVKKGTATVYSGHLKDLADQEVSSDVAAGTDETLTFTVTLPSETGNECQGKSATVKFTFDATQTNNSGWSESGV